MKQQMTKPTVQSTVISKCVTFTFSVASIINALLPKYKLISMYSLPDFTDNARALYEYIQKNNDIGVFKSHGIIWHVNNIECAKATNKRMNCNKLKCVFVKKNRPLSLLLTMLSDYIISTHGLYSEMKLSNRQTSIFLAHGMGIKRWGFLYDNDIALGIPQCDYYTVTSDFYKKIFINSYHVKPEQILVTGLPRNDWLFVNQKCNTILKLMKNGEKIIVFLPTYRNSNNSNRSNGEAINDENRKFGGTRDEWGQLNCLLQQTKQVMVVKPHPMEQNVDYSWMSTLSNVNVIDDEWLQNCDLTLNKLLAYSAKLITDYSSVYVDYLLLNRPICFFMPDRKSYTNDRGFVFDNINDYLPGPMCESFCELSRFVVDKDRYEEERLRIKKILNTVDTPYACRNLIDSLPTKS